MSREFLEQIARDLTQCLQLRSRNAELSALVDRRNITLTMLALAMADTRTPCPSEERDACPRKELRNCAQCWLDRMDKAAVRYLTERRQEAGEQQRGTA